VAELGPDDHSQPLLIIGAHYDAFGEMGSRPGADDNASGTAALLELARLLGNVHPRAPLMLVAYTNEEPPFFGSEKMGSAVHASALARENRIVRGMICMEMIGYYTREQSWPTPLPRCSTVARRFHRRRWRMARRKLARWVKRGIMGAEELTSSLHWPRNFRCLRPAQLLVPRMARSHGDRHRIPETRTTTRRATPPRRSTTANGAV
jgi:hypothetical protein